MPRTRPATRLYFPGEIPVHGVFTLPPEQAHHILHVLRLTVGETVTLFDGRGTEYEATLDRVARSGISVKVGEARRVSRESPIAVALAQGISSGERMDYTIQKAVELGVHAVQPIAAERSVVRLDSERGARRVAHWQAVAVAACEQCGRNRVPQVQPVASYAAWLAAAVPDARHGLMLSPRAVPRLRDLPRPNERVMLLAGPEGGLSGEEQQAAERAGFTPVKLGPRVLRTETAAVAALAAMQALWGDF